MPKRLRPRPTYANVVASLALFVALGGTSYAVSQIDGKNLRDRSVPGKKLKVNAVTGKELDLKHLVVPRAQLADRTRKLFVTHSRKHKRLAAAAAASTGNQSLLGLADGDTASLFASPPFTVSAHCANNTLKVHATSTEAGWWGPGTTAPLTTSDQFTLVDDTYSGTHYGANQAGTQSFAAPSGASLNIGSLVWGHNVFGYMCVVSAYAVGG